jgi:GTP cyclohydrolase III
MQTSCQTINPDAETVLTRLQKKFFAALKEHTKKIFALYRFIDYTHF